MHKEETVTKSNYLGENPKKKRLIFFLRNWEGILGRMKLLKEHGRHQQAFCRLQGSISTLVKKEQKKESKNSMPTMLQKKI